MLNAFLTPHSFIFDSRWRDHLNAISLRTEWLDVALFFIVAFFFTYLYFLYLFYLFLYCFYLLSIINLLFLLIILGFWGVLMFWIQVCLGLGSISVGISMAVGIFVGRFLGGGIGIGGGVGSGLKGWDCGGFGWQGVGAQPTQIFSWKIFPFLETTPTFLHK